MKHTPSVTAIMLAMFLLSQMVGLSILQAYADPAEPQGYKMAELGGVELERPETSGSQTIGLIGVAVLLGTALIFFLMKFNWHLIWKLWFALAITTCLALAFGAFIPQPYPLYAALLVMLWRMFKPNPIIHNLSELFIYGGLAVIFVPLLDINSAILLLILFSIYDAYAVWHSKHMVKLAKFQTQSKMFAGMVVPYSLKQPKLTKKSAKKVAKKGKPTGTIKTAILGGGDVGFPLFFSGTLLPTYGYFYTLLVPICCTAALYLLLTRGKQNTFYPAMPFLTTGALIGYALILSM